MEADKEFSLDIDVDVLPNSEREVVIGESICVVQTGVAKVDNYIPNPTRRPKMQALHIHDESTKEASTEIIGATVTEQWVLVHDYLRSARVGI